MKHWDIFCRVIDNYGDAGVCWRLAKQLAEEYGLSVRLWIDDLNTLASLVPEISPQQVIQAIRPGLTVCHWRTPFPQTHAADVVIEAFACTLPDSYVHTMAQQPTQPIWINLEYLSMEDWVAGCHELASPHPALGLMKYFFFPGPIAGGFLRESDLKTHQRSWTNYTCPAVDSVIPQDLHKTVYVSLFAYHNPALQSLLSTWAQGPQAVHCRTPVSLVTKQACSFFKKETLEAGDVITTGALTFEVLPFISQIEYDQLLWQSDLNFVRGEDSFVRGQLAGRPIVWQIYPQQEQAHLDKLNAFLKHYTINLSNQAQSACTQLHYAWNTKQECTVEWLALSHHFGELRQHAQQWRDYLFSQTDLVSNMYNFVRKKLM